ncbi:MAG: peptidase S8 [Bacteroidetes bacterium]|nr:MAG: peptidase S8 [Bacteroidota bacterium]PTM09216.1 MAG: peptidase S8 [Bacteroidota bacterium]
MRIYLLLPFLFCGFFDAALLASNWQTKIDPEVLAELEAGGRVEVIVALQEQADLHLAYRIHGKTAKGQYVYQTVRALAERTQQPIRKILADNGVAYRSFAVVNALLTEVDLPLARALAEREEVANIQPNPWTVFDRPTLDLTPTGAGRGVVEWGIQRIHADAVWDLGFRGEGITVAGQDTGYDWEHPAIKNQYRGWDGTTADHNYNWHDAIRAISLLHNDSIVSPTNNPCGLGVSVPCDDHSHGTHTMGTMVGDDGGDNQIGVAPAANWIGCRNMERGWGSPGSYIECFDWFLAPTNLAGENPDPARAPHVINNSWGCPAVEGCNPDNFALMELAIDALRAAGVVVVVSAGNDGPACGSIRNPAAIFAGSFSVGASRSDDTIANFSSRGAVTIDSSFRLKPNVVAPGVGVRSAIRNGGYATWNGTSMAGPHVAGAVALLLAAAPQLAGEVDSIEAILQTTALPLLSNQDCGPFAGLAVPNATYGYGRIDVLAAVARGQQVVATEQGSPAEPTLLFPNPTHGQFWVLDQTITAPTLFTLCDATGRQVLSVQLDNALQQITLGTLPAGIYFYRMGGGDQQGKLVVW